jgi:hypothetical protein
VKTLQILIKILLRIFVKPLSQKYTIFWETRNSQNDLNKTLKLIIILNI